MIISMLIGFTLTFVVAYQVGKRVERTQEGKRADLRNAVAKLPGWQPQILALRSEGYNYLEISAKLGLDKELVLTEMAKGFASLRMQQMPVEHHERRRGRVYLFVARQVLSRIQ